MAETRLAKCRNAYRCPFCGLSTLEGEHGISVRIGWRHEPEVGCRVKMIVHYPSKSTVIKSL